MVSGRSRLRRTARSAGRVAAEVALTLPFWLIFTSVAVAGSARLGVPATFFELSVFVALVAAHRVACVLVRRFGPAWMRVADS
jgi:hypothetical protein